MIQTLKDSAMSVPIGPLEMKDGLNPIRAFDEFHSCNSQLDTSA